jgi:hypothetical protein
MLPLPYSASATDAIFAQYRLSFCNPVHTISRLFFRNRNIFAAARPPPPRHEFPAIISGPSQVPRFVRAQTYAVSVSKTHPERRQSAILYMPFVVIKNRAVPLENP